MAFQQWAGSSTGETSQMSRYAGANVPGSTLPAETKKSLDAFGSGLPSSSIPSSDRLMSTPEASASTESDHNDGAPIRSGIVVTGMQKTRARRAVASGRETACAV